MSQPCQWRMSAEKWKNIPLRTKCPCLPDKLFSCLKAYCDEIDLQSGRKNLMAD